MKTTKSNTGIPMVMKENQHWQCPPLAHSDTSDNDTWDTSSPSCNQLSSPELINSTIHQSPFNSDSDCSWTAQDNHFAKLFHGWDDLPLNSDASTAQRLNVLRQMESIIVPFERAIQGTDKGFNEWRQRHQRAMEEGQAAPPDWPQLFDGGKKCWVNEKWYRRYHQLVNNREKIISDRLRGVGVAMSSQVRGKLVPRPERVTLRCRSGRGNKMLPEFWNRSLDECLEIEGRRRKMTPGSLVKQFWAPLLEGNQVPALTMSSDSGLSSPNSHYAMVGSGHCLERSQTLTKDCHEAIKIESDSE